MPKYDKLEVYRNGNPKQKLAVLRSEMITPIATIRGYSALMKKINFDTTNNLPEDFRHWIDAIVEASDDLKEILDTLTT